MLKDPCWHQFSLDNPHDLFDINSTINNASPTTNEIQGESTSPTVLLLRGRPWPYNPPNHHVYGHHIHLAPLHGLRICSILSPLLSHLYLQYHNLPILLQSLTLIIHHHCLHHCLTFQTFIPQLFPDCAHCRVHKKSSGVFDHGTMDFSPCEIYCDNKISTHFLLKIVNTI